MPLPPPRNRHRPAEQPRRVSGRTDQLWGRLHLWDRFAAGQMSRGPATVDAGGPNSENGTLVRSQPSSPRRFRSRRRPTKCEVFPVKSWELLKEATERIGVKAVAARLNLSTALVYKWCQEPASEDPDASGARNPLDRLRTVYEATGDQRIINWMCAAANGFYVSNPQVTPGEHEEQLLNTTQRMVEDFGNLLSSISGSIEDDGLINGSEPDVIRQSWERLKSQAECFVVACEQGLYSG